MTGPAEMMNDDDDGDDDLSPLHTLLLLYMAATMSVNIVFGPIRCRQ